MLSNLNRIYRRVKLIGRALRGKDLFPKTDLKAPWVRYGSEGGEWRFIPGLLNRHSIVYSAGVGTNISFDLALIKNFGIEVFAFDPTPKVREWLSTQDVPENFHFETVGLFGSDGVLKFNAPTVSEYISYSIIDRDEGNQGEGELMEVKSLSTITRSLGHDHIDLLKMDIEGSEYDVIEKLRDGGIYPRQLLVEFHHRWGKVGVQKTRDAIARLREIGYRVFAISESGEEYSFLLKG